MSCFITFLEGMITFISPCVLPMIPVYALYFTAGPQTGKAGRALMRALGFVLGFTLLFVALGVFAATLGSLLAAHQRAVNLVTGAVVVLFGLHYMGVLRIGALQRTVRPDVHVQAKGFFSCVLLGAVFAVGWSPCTGAFLGSAMMLAASESGAMQGMLLLLCYSAGLGVPFVLCALLVDRLKGAFAVIRRHYAVVNRVCDAFLVLVGVLMMTGLFTRLSALLS